MFKELVIKYIVRKNRRREGERKRDLIMYLPQILKDVSCGNKIIDK